MGGIDMNQSRAEFNKIAYLPWPDSGFCSRRTNVATKVQVQKCLQMEKFHVKFGSQQAGSEVGSELKRRGTNVERTETSPP
jgi:hypothetical protein